VTFHDDQISPSAPHQKPLRYGFCSKFYAVDIAVLTVCCSAADDDFLVQVRAQVMTRDDSSGGWLPRNGGGMSVVGVHAPPSPTNSHYMIRGRRVCDQAVRVLTHILH